MTQLLFTGHSLQPFHSFVDFLWVYSRTCKSFLNWEAQNRMQYSRMKQHQQNKTGKSPLLSSWWWVFLMHCRMGLVFVATMAPCWLLLSLLWPATTAPFLQSCCPVIPLLIYLVWIYSVLAAQHHSFLVKFNPTNHCSSLSRSFCKTSCPSKESTNSTSQSGIMSKFANGSFTCCIQSTDKCIEQSRL